jgi:hypothetical protein
LEGILVAVGLWFALEGLLLFVLFLIYVLEARLLTHPKQARIQWLREPRVLSALVDRRAPHRAPVPTDSAA